MREIARARLSAEARRAAVLDTAAALFAKGSYHGTTTAEIARKAGVSEPILYRHFQSKRDLYLACIDEAWRSCRALWDDVLAAEPESSNWLRAMGEAYIELTDQKLQLANLWVQALTEPNEDPQIRRALRRQIREVHAYVRDVIVRAQEAGGYLPEHDATAEAWLFISVGLLVTVDRRLGGVLNDDFPRIAAARRRWLTGRQG